MPPGISAVEGVLAVGLFGFLVVLVTAGLIGGIQGEKPKRRHRSSGHVDGGTNRSADYGSHSSRSSDCGGHDGGSADCGGFDGGSGGGDGGSGD